MTKLEYKIHQTSIKLRKFSAEVFGVPNFIPEEEEIVPVLYEPRPTEQLEQFWPTNFVAGHVGPCA